MADMALLGVALLVTIVIGVAGFPCGRPRCSCVYDQDMFVYVDCTGVKNMTGPPLLRYSIYTYLAGIDMTGTQYCRSGARPSPPVFCRVPVMSTKTTLRGLPRTLPGTLTRTSSLATVITTTRRTTRTVVSTVREVEAGLPSIVHVPGKSVLFLNLKIYPPMFIILRNRGPGQQ